MNKLTSNKSIIINVSTRHKSRLFLMGKSGQPDLAVVAGLCNFFGLFTKANLWKGKSTVLFFRAVFFLLALHDPALARSLLLEPMLFMLIPVDILLILETTKIHTSDATL